jgi:hypothetical protein
MLIECFSRYTKKNALIQLLAAVKSMRWSYDATHNCGKLNVS